MLQNVVDRPRPSRREQVASQILALQNGLSASYQTTSMLAGLTLTKFLPVAAKARAIQGEAARARRGARHKAFVNHSCLLLLKRVNAALAAIGAFCRTGQARRYGAWGLSNA